MTDEVDPSDVAGSDAGTAIVAALRAIGERLDALEPAAIADEPDAIHQLRTHVRRLRSVLAAYAPLFDASVAEGIRRRYREFGRELGTVRDIEVRVQVAERALEEAGEGEDADGTRDALDADHARARERAVVRARLVAAELETHRLAHARFVERQRMPRATARRLVLAEFLDAPPLTPLAAGPAHEVLGDLLAHEGRRTVARAERLTASADPDELHAVRKAGRRLRYAAEAVTTEPVVLFGARAEALAEAGERLHDVLGDHRDELLFAEHARRAAAHAAHQGEPAGLLEHLAAAADRRASAHVHGLTAVRRELRRAAERWAAR
ncbi:CHAD domain-containing protein [Agromyces sp. H66]|uniref:CHAD domain-containing protein n=1 Tax=Agromyces sp. H66 TaxID=2529859 RepID=UPI0010AB33E2|nr:CHAD domain-containing protein [Agromyces sp. H66]